MALAALCAVAQSACGGSTGGGDDAARTVRSAPHAPPSGSPLDLPPGVPLRSSGAHADPAQTRVIRAWADALRGGNIAAASALWAVPSKVQNGTPVVGLRSRAAVRLFNASLPCGALVTASGGAAAGFTIVTVRLTKRRGADCGPGAGSSARTAIRVRGGRIVEWYRLPDESHGHQPPIAPAGNGSGTTV